MTRVRTSEDTYIKDVYHRAGAEFEFEPTTEDGSLPHFLTDLDADDQEEEPGPTPDAPPLTKEDLRAKLAMRGIKTAPQTGITRLLELLGQSEGAAPASPGPKADASAITGG
jgi:hypothetical protein